MGAPTLSGEFQIINIPVYKVTSLSGYERACLARKHIYHIYHIYHICKVMSLLYVYIRGGRKGIYVVDDDVVREVLEGRGGRTHALRRVPDHEAAFGVWGLGFWA